MNDTSSPAVRPTVLKDFLATVWPLIRATDSATDRRKKIGVRAGQLTLAVMVLLGLAGTVIANFPRLSGGRIVELAAVSFVYILWSLYGMRDAVRFLFLERWTENPSLWAPGRRFRAASYFAVQLGLAGLLYGLGSPGYGSGLLWLVLLPPIAHSVILLPRFGIAIVSLLSVSIFVFGIAWWFGWSSVPNAVLQFGFAVIFTVIFSLLAVSSEKARGETQRLACELSDANLKLREYAVQAEELAAARERNRMAREIHDSVGHYLTVVNVQLEAAGAVLDRDPSLAKSALEKAQSLTRDGLKEIRRSVAALRASPLDNQSLADALRQIVKESATSGVVTDLQVLGQTRALSAPAELTLYRAGQEGLTNVRKHARAANAHLVLDYRGPGKVLLSVRDDGAGGQEGSPAGFGLLGVRERAQLLGGNVRVQTAPGAGFILEVEVPG